MELTEINVELREELGSTAVKRLRRDGKVPGVMYSEGGDSLNIAANALELSRKVTDVSHAHLYKLSSTNSSLNGRRALIKDVQVEPLKEKIIHFDLYEIHEGHKITVTVPVELVGECPAVKQKVALLSQALFEVEIECQPTEIPKRLELDISSLIVGRSLFVSDLIVPEGMRLKTDKKQNIVSAVLPKEEVAAAPAAAAAQPAAGTTPAATTEAKPKGKEKD